MDDRDEAPAPAVPPGFAALPDLTRILLDKMTEGVSLSREDGTIVYTNPAEDRMFGYAPGELIGQHVSVQNAYPPAENDRIVAEVIAELRRSGSWQGDWRNRRRDGTEFVTRSRISTVEIDGRPHWLCVQEDVTAAAEAAEALRQSRARLELATAAAELGIWDWDLLGNRMTYSPLAKAISGFPLDAEVTFEMVRDIVHPEDYPRTSSQSRRALDPAIRDRDPYEYRILWPNGEVRWCLARGEAIFAETDGVERAIRYVGTIQDITARRDLEEAERAANQRLRLAIECGRLAVWEVDLVADTLTGSAELNRLLDFPEDVPLDLQAVRARYYPGERERIQALGRAAIARGDRFIEAEFRYLWSDGQVRWLLLRCELLPGPDGALAKALGVLTDVTERRSVEDALRASEARLQLARAAAGAGIWERNLVTGESVWSPEEYELLGVDPATPMNELHQAWVARAHPEDRRRADTDAQAAVEAGGTYTTDLRILRPDGSTRWIRSHATVVTDPGGRPERMVGIDLDVTAEHREKEDLRARTETLATEVEERRRELDRFYALSNDLFAVGGFDGYLKTINPAWSRQLGHPDAELLSRPFADFIHPDDHAGAGEAMARLRSGETLRRYEHRLVHADGGTVWVAWAAVPAGELFYAVGRDITRDREREEILRQSQKMEAIGQLTGGIAHDFNNLLQAVQGSLDLIRKKPADAGRVHRLAEQGLQAAGRGAKLTAQLLAFSRAQRLEVRPVALAGTLSGLEDLLRRSLGPMIGITLNLPPPDLAVLADLTQLEMAVLNLAINARDAMAEGGEIVVRATPRAIRRDPELPSGDYVLLSVDDTGAGMPPEIAERAFEPFFTTKGVGKGTGLGLSQVYGMARQSGGTVRLASRPGQGTTVTVYLRQVALPPADDRSRLDLGPSGEAAPSAKVLVVDDDPDVRRTLLDAVEALGYRPIEAEDGPSGLNALDLEPDILLVDYAMPGMTGAEFAKAALRRRPDLPIVFATGYADTAAIDAAVSPAATILRKPFELAELEAVLARALARP